MTARRPTRLPTVDVLVSTFNEEDHLPGCLDAVLGQDYPSDRLRLLLIDGGSTDSTVEVARRRAATDPRVEVVADGERRNLPAALNLAQSRSSADLVAKIDAHGYPEPDYLRLAALAFQSGGPELGCVGGRPVQEGETRFGRAVALARTSRFGVGGSEYAGASERAMVDTVQCGVYRRDVLDEVGWFDPEMNFGEDDELELEGPPRRLRDPARRADALPLRHAVDLEERLPAVPKLRTGACSGGRSAPRLPASPPPGARGAGGIGRCAGRDLGFFLVVAPLARGAGRRLCTGRHGRRARRGKAYRSAPRPGCRGLLCRASRRIWRRHASRPCKVDE